MARCPECGSWIWGTSGYLETRVCPHCGVVLKRKTGLDGFLFGSMEPADRLEQFRRTRKDPSGQIDWSDNGNRFGGMEAGGRLAELRRTRKDPSGQIDWSDGEPRSRTEEPRISDRGPSLGTNKAELAHCNHCEAVIMPSNAKFCSSCGASLRQGSKDTTPPGMEYKAKQGEPVEVAMGHGEKCMVCNLEVKEGDYIVWCPHCGNPAHGAHLLEWIHTRRACPICGEHLAEQELLRRADDRKK